MPAVSVLIPTRDKAPFLDLTLASFVGQRHADHELVVVDDGSADGTPAVLEAYRTTLPLVVVRQEPRGRAAARNAGLAASSGEIVIFTDDDRLVGPSFVDCHARHHHAAAAATALMGWQRGILTHWSPEIRLRAAWVASLVERRPDLAAVFRDGRTGPLVAPGEIAERFDEVTAALGLPEPIFEDAMEPVVARHTAALDGFRLAWFIGATANLSIPMQVARAIGPFDEGFVGYGFEDNDYGRRLCAAGVAHHVSRDAVSFHQKHGGRGAGYRANLEYFADKYPGEATELFLQWKEGTITAVAANAALGDRLHPCS